MERDVEAAHGAVGGERGDALGVGVGVEAAVRREPDAGAVPGRHPVELPAEVAGGAVGTAGQRGDLGVGAGGAAGGEQRRGEDGVASGSMR